MVACTVSLTAGYEHTEEVFSSHMREILGWGLENCGLEIVTAVTQNSGADSSRYARRSLILRRSPARPTKRPKRQKRRARSAKDRTQGFLPLAQVYLLVAIWRRAFYEKCETCVLVANPRVGELWGGRGISV